MLAYNKILVDTSNVFYRLAATFPELNENVTSEKVAELIKQGTLVTKYLQIIEKLKLQCLGEVCLLFDPMSTSKGTSERHRIKESYKTNRDKSNPLTLLRADTLERLYSKLLIEPLQKVAVYHDTILEADDFAEKLTERDKCLMMTSDKDFSRYLEEGRVEMLIKGLKVTESGIYTVKHFEKDNGFKPNIASVTFWKVFYGDASDNIIGVFYDSSTKVIRTASEEMKSILRDLGEGLLNLSEAKIGFYNGTGRFEKLSELLKLSNTERSYEKLLDLADTNFKLVESMLPRDSDISINNYRVSLDLNLSALKKKKFSLNQRKF